MRQQIPNYGDLGHSDIMGPKLRALVELQLAQDLVNYGIRGMEYRYDWSESCIEGHRLQHLDGEIENFSGIGVFDAQDQLIAGGWMEFVHDKNLSFFLCYWEFVNTYQNGTVIGGKNRGGIPPHIWHQIPEVFHNIWSTYRMRDRGR